MKSTQVSFHRKLWQAFVVAQALRKPAALSGVGARGRCFSRVAGTQALMLDDQGWVQSLAGITFLEIHGIKSRTVIKTVSNEGSYFSRLIREQ
ncbi:MAG: hypothetical protein ACFHX7_15825 [Pseudomonadota bacterium]